MNVDQPTALAWCVVANVAQETAQGPGGLEIRAGTKHFAAGAKLWVLPPQWGDGGDKLFVVGRHRGSRGLIRLVVQRRHLTAFRVRMIYSPAVLRSILRAARSNDRAPRLWTDKAEAEAAVARWNVPTLDAFFDDTPHSSIVDDPPPAELEYDGRIYHLAHFNANRARFWASPPPEERGFVVGP
jgi:hypothetical protein